MNQTKKKKHTQTNEYTNAHKNATFVFIYDLNLSLCEEKLSLEFLLQL